MAPADTSSTPRFLTVNGDRLEYRLIEGSSRAELTLVLLHHGLGCVALWDAIPDRLAAATGCSVLGYSRLGYGRSDANTVWPKPVDYQTREARDSLPAVLDAAGIGAHVPVGHSDGATIAAVHCAGGDGRVRGGVVIAPHFCWEKICTDEIARIDRAYHTTDLRDKLARHHVHVDGAFLGWSKSWLQPDFRKFDTRALLPRITCPMLGVQGLDDEYGTLIHLETLEAQSGGPVEIATLADCGHMAHRDQPDKLIELISDFTATLG